MAGRAKLRAPIGDSETTQRNPYLNQWVARAPNRAKAGFRLAETFSDRVPLAGLSMARNTLSENVEMYLETIYVLTEKGDLARTKDIAAEWQVSAPSATEMVQKLAAAGYLHYEPYKGSSLTKQGVEIGRAVIRKHRLLERFLTDIVGVENPRAEEAACRMEHAIPREMERWVCELLGHPRLDSHGAPIPPGPCCES